jgi:Tfp pilus assembly protein PilF
MRVALALALGAAFAPSLAHAGLLEGNHPKVQQGTEAYGKGDWEGALKAYEEAQRELPNNPELQYNLGDAYMKLGRTDDARRAYEAALAKAGDKLKPRDYYNLGNAFVGLNQKDDAVTAYRQALKLDPSFEPARHNLEVLLRKKNPPQQGPPSPGDGGTPPDAGRDAGPANDGGKSKDSSDGGGSDASSGDGGQSGASDASSDAGGGDGGQGKADGGKGGDGGQGGDGGSQGQGDGGTTADGGSQDGGNMSQDQRPPEQATPVKDVDVQRLLDAVRRNEKQFLMEQHNRKKDARRRPEKDW